MNKGKKPSEIFEGENSSLRKTFERVTTPNEKKCDCPTPKHPCSCACHPEKECLDCLCGRHQCITCHTSQESGEEGWEERLLNLQATDLEDTQIQLPLDKLKSFIRSELSLSKARWEAELVEECEGKKRDVDLPESFLDEYIKGMRALRDSGYNEALQEIIDNHKIK